MILDWEPLKTAVQEHRLTQNETDRVICLLDMLIDVFRFTAEGDTGRLRLTCGDLRAKFQSSSPAVRSVWSKIYPTISRDLGERFAGPGR